MIGKCLKVRSSLFLALGVGLIAATVPLIVNVASNQPAIGQPAEDDAQIARSLATMLRAGRTVISNNQQRINDPGLGDKGLSGKNVLAESVEIYRKAMDVDPLAIDGKSRHGKLIRVLMDSIVEVMDVHQQTINRQGVGFKGFIPAVFGRLVNESFARRAAGLAEMKVTAPPELIRNAKAKPDHWEAEVIKAKLSQSSWPRNQPFAEVSQNKGRRAFRTAVPEYYAASCLSCHGGPKGEIDVTGYPKDGAAEGDLGGVISITLYR